MRRHDFENQFYFNGGSRIVQIGEVIEDAHSNYWRVDYDPATDEVKLKNRTSGEMLEPERQFLHDCTVPLDQAKAEAA